MDTRERLLVNRLVARIAEAPDAPKDADAQAEIGTLLRVRPDAPYLLMQRALMLEAALEQAQAKLEQLSAGAPAVLPSAPGMPAPMSQPVGAGGGAPASSTGGFLRNAASIGAGVVGGSLLFQGIESLLHGGRSWGGGLGQAPVEVFETNNFIQSADVPDRPDPMTGVDVASLQDDSLFDDGSSLWS